MSKKPKAVPKRVVSSKPMLPKWEREKRRRRALMTVIAVVIVATLAVVSYGLYDTKVKPWHQTMVEVDNRGFDMNYFVKMLRLSGASGKGIQEQAQIAQQVVTATQNNELVRQKAKELGISATGAELEQELQTQTGYDPAKETLEEFDLRIETALKNIKVSRGDFEKLFIEPVVLQRKVRESIGSSDYPRDAQYDYADIKAFLVGTREKALAVREAWSEDFDQIVKDYSPDQYFPRGGYWLLQVLELRGEGDAKELRIQGIMLDTEAKAQELKTQIAAGGDFATLAQANSIHSSGQSGGDLGWLGLSRAESRFGAGISTMEFNVLSDPIAQFIEWLPAGILSPDFDGYAFAAGSESSGVSEPVRDTMFTTKGGYWLVKLVDRTGDGDEQRLNIQAIFVDSGEEAQTIKAEIDAGGDFTTIAQEKSLHASSSSNGGNMSLLSLDSVKSQFGADNLETIKALAIGGTSDPLLDAQTSKQSGYWVIEVLAKEKRDLNDDNWDVLSQKAFDSWFKQRLEESELKSYLDDYEKLSWALANI